MTINYKVSLTHSKKKITPGFLTRSKIPETSSLIDFMEDTDDYVYITESTCREVLVHRIRQINNTTRKGLKKGINYWVTMSSTGDNAHALYSAMVRSKERERVQNLLNSVFGIEMFITLHRFSRNIPDIMVRGKSKLFPGYYKAHFDLSKVKDSIIHPATISAIYGILRETRVIHKILKGEIYDAKTLVRELVSISYDRMLMKDKTPPTLSDLWGLGHDTVTKEYITTSWTRYLLSPLNSTGSDWVSLLCLATYIGIASETVPEYDVETNFYRTTLESAGGPISSVISMHPEAYFHSMHTVVEVIDQFEGSAHLIEIATSIKDIAESSGPVLSLVDYL